ncbi:MAG TPA: squalene/phytoene synthase family protein [Anaerolineales bacterium]
MSPSPAANLTKAASLQAYYTIRLFVDRERVEDAFRSYAYYRWVDDVLDGSSGSAAEHREFLDRQKALLTTCEAGGIPQVAAGQEEMLVELIRQDPEKNSGLRCYLRTMMQVMEFDAGRRGKLISKVELDTYTRLLALAVTENMHYFIGHHDHAPREDARYRAVSAAHIVHMLRDTHEDVDAGYYNVPRELLDANHIGPEDVDSPPYQAWVKGRVALARQYFKSAKDYLSQVGCLRYRLAECAYASRFEWVLEKLENEGYRIRPEYNERRSTGPALRMGWCALAALIGVRPAAERGPTGISRPLDQQ